MNINPHHRYSYSDKHRISVVSLTQIGRATEKDKRYGIDLWARVLTAKNIELANKDAELAAKDARIAKLLAKYGHNE